MACALNAAAGLIAVAVDGKDEVTLVHCTASEDGGVTLRVSGEHSVGGVVLPTRLAFAPDGALWVAGGPCSDAAKSVHVATCRLAGAPGTLHLFSALSCCSVQTRWGRVCR